MSYAEFLERKSDIGGKDGFSPMFMPDTLFPFQRHLVEWATLRGRAALIEDCGLGKTLQQLVWAQNVYLHTGRPVLILTPLAVAAQTVAEGIKFGIECHKSAGTIDCPIVVTNYEKLHRFNAGDFAGVVCDESSILKNFDGATRTAVTEFAKKIRYRLLCTATAAPNDYIELGTSSEVLGELGHMDMLSRFFKNDQNSNHPNRNWAGGAKWRFRGHSAEHFWRWVASWARAVRKPSDIGFDDGGFDLPPLSLRDHRVTARVKRQDMLFDLPAVTLAEQRAEQRRTLTERCETAAALVADTGKSAVCWCHLNDEGDTLTRMIPGAVQVSGKDSDDEKESAFEAFAAGQIRVLVTKPKVGGFGLNWQHCAHQTFFPSHSFEQWYQSIRRSWRFGQTQPVTIDVITSEGQAGVLGNMQRKAKQADVMFARLVANMNDTLRIEKRTNGTRQLEAPTWL